MSSLAHPAFATRAEAVESARGAMRTAAGLALVPAAVDLALVGSRFSQFWAYGVLSAVAGVGAAGLAVALATGRARPWMLHAGIWGAMVLLVSFIVTHTAGVVFGPERGAVGAIEPLGVAGAVATAGLLLSLCALLGGRARSHTLTALALVAMALWGVSLLGGLAPANANGKAVGHKHANPGLPLPFIPQDVREKYRAPAGHETPLRAGG